MTSISVTRSGTVLVPTQYPVWDWVPWGPSSREGAASLLQWPLLYVSTTHFLGQATPVPKGMATPASYGDSAAGRVCHPCGSQVRRCPPEPAVEVKSRIPNTWGSGGWYLLALCPPSPTTAPFLGQLCIHQPIAKTPPLP